MNRLFVSFLGLLITTFVGVCDGQELHVCTVASKHTRGLEQLLHSCRYFDIQIDVLGMDQPFRGLSEKFLLVEEYIRKLDDKDIVLFVDAYDTLFLEGTENILNKFYKMEAPFVISVERYCWPYRDRWKEFPEGPTSFRYINTGTYIGYVYQLRQIFKELAPIYAGQIDQGIMTLHYFKNPDLYTFDSTCTLFMPMAGMARCEIVIDQKAFNVTCVETGTTPSIIHGNGGSKPHYQWIYDTLFGG